MASVNNNSPGSVTPGGVPNQGFRLVGFPKEFEKNIWESFDRRYYLILLITWVFFYSITFYMGSREWTISAQDRETIRQNYMQSLYAELEIPEETVAPEEEGIGAQAEETGAGEEQLNEESQKLTEESATEKVERRKVGAGVRRQQRRKMEQEAAGYGVLGALTAAGGSGSGSAYADILGDAGNTGSGIANAAELASGAAAGLRAATGQGDRSRIARGGGYGNEVGEGIDQLIQDVGTGGGSSVARRGSIKLGKETKISGRGASSAQRDPEVIDATINQNKGSVEFCYQRQLKVDPTLRGEILLSFDILPNGRVGAVKLINSTMGNKKVENCIRKAVGHWRNFPKIKQSEGIVTIKTKFVFG